MFLNYVCILLLCFINETINVAINTTENETVNVVDANLIESIREINDEKRIRSYHKYKFDENYHLHRLHSTKEAKIFIEGCSGMYSDVKSNNKNDALQRTFPVDNPERLIIFGIFSLQEFSIILYLDERSLNPNYVNLRINRNSLASISGTGKVDNGSFIDNLSQIPSMPYYIAINLTNYGEVHVSELRKVSGICTPFLKYKYTDRVKSLKPKYFRIDHIGPIYAYHSCCELQCKRQIFHRISGCSKYSTGSASTKRTFDINYYNNDQENIKTSFTFSGNFFIDRPESTAFAAKFRFYDHNRKGDYYDIVLTDTQTTIYHHISSENATIKDTLSFELEKITPVTINITITERGRVWLTQTYDTKPFMIYNPKRLSKDRVNIKAMSMTKLYDDGIRYDFYYNCSSVLTYFNETVRLPATKIIDKPVKRLNETQYDLVQIFNQTFNMDEKYGKFYNEKFLDFDDVEFIDNVSFAAGSDDSSNGYATKTITGVCSFLFVAILKFVTSLSCVKNLINEQYPEAIKKSQEKISIKFDAGISKFFGEDD